MNFFFKTLTGAFAVLLLQATPLPAAETEPLRLAMVSEGCRPGTSPVQLDDGTLGCAEVIEVSGGGGGGGNPALNLPDRRGGGSSDWPESTPSGGGAGGGDWSEETKARTRVEKQLKGEKKNCLDVYHGKWTRYKPSANVYRARCEWPSPIRSDEFISRLYDGSTGSSFRQCYYKANVTGAQNAVRCEYPDHSPCAVPPSKQPPMCTEDEPSNY